MNHPATVHGAYLSGQDAAQAIDEAFKSKKIGGEAKSDSGNSSSTTTGGKDSGASELVLSHKLFLTLLVAVIVAFTHV